MVKDYEELGEIYKVYVNNKPIIIREIIGDSCKNCYFNENKIDCTKISRPVCSALARYDNVGVIFERIIISKYVHRQTTSKVNKEK